MSVENNQDSDFQECLQALMLDGPDSKVFVQDILLHYKGDLEAIKLAALKGLRDAGRADLVPYWSEILTQQIKVRKQVGILTDALYTAESIQDSIIPLLLDGLKNSGSIEYLLAGVNDEQEARSLALVNLIKIGEVQLANIWCQFWIAEKKKLDQLEAQGLRIEF